MPAKIDRDFHEIIGAISTCVADGYVARSGDILELMSALSHQRIALRYFLHKASADVRFRRLTSAQSFYVYGCDQFYFRMNAWYPKSTVINAESASLLDRYFSIDSCHNHSVDFFTVGLMGPGYTTEFRETHEDLTTARLGDRIRFGRSWNDQLAEGRALFVPKSSVFHTQYAPEAYSLSLNLVVREPVLCNQFTLADDKETICDVYDLRDAAKSQESLEWF